MQGGSSLNAVGVVAAHAEDLRGVFDTTIGISHATMNEPESFGREHASRIAELDRDLARKMLPFDHGLRVNARCTKFCRAPTDELIAISRAALDDDEDITPILAPWCIFF